MRDIISQSFHWLRRVALVTFVVVTGGSAAFLATQPILPKAGQPAATVAETVEKLTRVGRDTITVPDQLGRNMSLRTVPVATRTKATPLPALQGCLALDTNRLARIHSRFAGEIVTLGTRMEASEESAGPRPRSVQVGDTVRQGDLLAVVWSKDLGEKKSELVDAISKLRSDEVTLRRLEDAAKDGGIPERSLRDAQRAVDADMIAVERAERTLRAWRLTEAEIQAIRTEADNRKNADAQKLDPATWARVEVRAPQDGVILEKNLAVGDIVDTTADLFKIGDMSKLVVWVHVYEEDLPMLQALPKPVKWTVKLPSRPGATYAGRLEQVGAVIDPNQHTALASGHVANSDGDLKVGQFVTVSVELPPPAGEIELPADAVVEDGRESVIFVQAKNCEGKFIRTPVKVTSRFRDTLCVRAGAGVAVGDHVVTSGSILLREAMETLPVPQ